MTFLHALQTVLAADPRGNGYLRWQTHLIVALAMSVNALIAFLVGYTTAAIAFHIMTIVCAGFVLAGIGRGVHRELKGAS
jgi:hypothetical protein